MTNSDETADKAESTENGDETVTAEREREIERRKREVFRRAASNLMASSEDIDNKPAD